jgi:processive 1,2-diacylglycerol beta-glucosyltransferase
MWLSRLFHRYFVAIDETKAHMEALGLPSERITVAGIPIDPVFSEPLDRTQTRIAYGLDPARTTLLVSAGTLGVGPTEVIVRRLAELRHPVQTIVVCGKSEALKEKIVATVGAHNPAFHVLGYTTRMHELMRISDLFIGKPGGLTTSEALACGLPMVVVSPIPGQEEGAAIRCNEMTTVPFKIDRLLDDPERLARMTKRAQQLGRPDAARNVVEALLADQLPPLIIPEEQREAMAHAAARE